MLACMVLAAGLGTRLRPLTDALPKALVPIGDESALAHAVKNLRRAGATSIVANAHHHARAVEAACAELAIGCSTEAELLGTAGGLAKARGALGGADVLVWNADMFAPAIDPAWLAHAHEEAHATATLLVREIARGTGNVGWNDAGEIVRLRQETVREGETRAGEFLGIHVVGGALALPSSGCLVGDVYLPHLRAGGILRVLCTDRDVHDIGAPATYLDANRAWLGARASFVAPDAKVTSGVSVDRSVIGRGAIVEADAIACVVWPGAIVREPITRAIVTPSAIVRVD